LLSEDEKKKKVLEKAKRSDVRLVVFQFVDILGTIKNVTMTVNRLEDALNEGIPFDGSSVEGFVRIFESDMVAMPDPTTFKILPWRPNERKEARIICDIHRPGGKPFEGDPRYILKRVINEVKKQGYYYNTGPELEFFLFKNAEGYGPVTHDFGGYFDYSPLDLAFDIRREVTFNLQEMGFEIEQGHHEVAPGQHEIDFRFDDALQTADKVITYKMVIKAIAFAHQLTATFMPKPISGQNGSGMHVHQSLFKIKNNHNAFYDSDDKYSLSKTAYYFIGGQLKHIRGMSGILAPTVNSYKRLVPGYEAPVYICWGRRNRSALIRVPDYFPGKEKAIRAELRCPDPSCNPYLAFAVMLKAGMDGVKNKIEPPEPVEEDVYEFDDQKLAQFYIKTLPESLGEAIEEMKESKILKEALGDFTFGKYLEAKKSEWKEYQLHVSDWEIEKYIKL
jgi:glutamine synthetase